MSLFQCATATFYLLKQMDCVLWEVETLCTDPVDRGSDLLRHELRAVGDGRFTELRIHAQEPGHHLPLRIGLKKWNERMKFGTNSRIFCLFPHFSGSFYQNLETFHHFLRISVKFWENFIKISRKNDQNSSTKIGMKWNFISFRQKSLTIFNWNFEVLAVRRQRNLVDLEKSWKMRLFSLS